MMHSAGASEELPATAQIDRPPDGRTIALKSSSLEPAPSDEGYDPNLVSQSRVEYESHGARIGNVRIENGDGQCVNVLQLGHVYTVAYEVSFSAPARRVIFGFQAKNPSGLVLAGASNRDVTAAQIEAVAAGETYAVRFDFVCRYLPSTFLMDVGVFAIQGDEIRFLHRILDAAMFRVAPETDLFDQGLFSLNAGLTARPIHSDMLAGAAQTTLTKK
jgi:lipopolysaccharide transport system ATP-binding protein